jgi:drug/metabolite transporter (DMT)-like permease
MTPKSKATLMVLSAAVLWSTGGVLIKSVDWNAISIASSRCLLAAFSLCIYMRRLPRRPRDLPSLSCALTYSILVISFVLATKMTTAANAILLQYTAPIYVAILAPFFIKEPTRGRDWLFIVVTIGGIVLFFMDSLSPEGMGGNLMALFSGVVFACFCILLRRADDLTDVIVWGNIMAFGIGLPFMDFQHLPSLPGWLCLLALGFLQLGLGYFIYSLAAPYLSALELIVIPSIEPILNPALAALFIGEIPGSWSLAGGIIVLVTITSWSIIKARDKK